MRDRRVTWEGLFREGRPGEKVSRGAGGINADYAAHCETETGDSQV